MGTQATVSVTVVICAYTELRWPLLLAAIRSIRAQTRPASQVIVVVDHNTGLYSRLRMWAGHEVVLENVGPRGLSGARNTGVAAATGDVVAFLDDDAQAAPDWLENLIPVFDEPEVIAVGGRIEPEWESSRPAYFARELDWIVGCTYRGMPSVAAEVRNVIGANMSFRREVFGLVGGFNTGMGRVGALPVGCEETELCIRASIRLPSSRVVYEPAAAVAHHVSADRAAVRYMLSRAWSEGISKARVSRLVGQRRALHSERHYARVVLPRAFAAGLRDWRHGAGLRRSAIVVAVLAATTAGYLRGRLVLATPRLTDSSRPLDGQSMGENFEHAA